MNRLSMWAQLRGRTTPCNCDRLLASSTSVIAAGKALVVIPNHLSLLVLLSLMEGFSCRDIANIAGIEVGSVNTKLRQWRTMSQLARTRILAGDGGLDVAAERVRRIHMS